MGNRISPCFGRPPSSAKCSGCRRLTNIVFWGGATRQVVGKFFAGEVMSEFPDHVVCHAESLFIGCQVPALSIEDELLPGETYFVLPLDRFPTRPLTVAALMSLCPAIGSARKPPLLSSGENPFEYVNGADGKVVIKVLPGFVTKIISSTAEESGQQGGGRQESEGDQRPVDSDNCGGGELCSTPELKKHYEQLVGPRDRPWSPKLETITERKNKITQRFSPARLLGKRPAS